MTSKNSATVITSQNHQILLEMKSIAMMKSESPHNYRAFSFIQAIYRGEVCKEASAKN
jgi:hypothetical protein